VQALIDPPTRKSDLLTPGHLLLPSDPKDEGSCAAAVTLRPASISSRPAGVISDHEEDGSTARLSKL